MKCSNTSRYYRIMGEIMIRLFYFLCAFLASALPQASWAGSGGPSAGAGSTGAWIIMALLVIIIILLALILKKLK